MNTPQTTTPAQGLDIRRSRRGRVLFGVAAGLARRYSLTPLAVRLIFVIAALLVVGVIFYVVAALAWR